ncbi:MoxR family ATPase [Actinoplanes sp. NPDC049548]|uniref:AAA family ATPase n=1 Tax=Actinoplanes sp. NPDC049548 TaxID=3155152 RepID=UPI00342A6BCF
MPERLTAQPSANFGGPDRRDGTAYLMSEELELAVQVALATRRPLLVRGDPGAGKSSLAACVASRRNWRYYEHVVTSRTLAQDLLWTFDHVRRLADAQIHAARGEDLDDCRYISPGVLWWAFDRTSALRRGAPGATTAVAPAEEPRPDINTVRGAGVVVLIDEIDKADPDVPNGLLVALGSREFTVSDTGTRVCGSAGADSVTDCLIVVTTNEERELPQAFVRRCVVISLPSPTRSRLVEIAKEHLHFGNRSWTAQTRLLAEELAGELDFIRISARDAGLREPSTAEYLDALYACLDLQITVNDDRWRHLREFVFLKGSRPEEGP